MPHQARIPDEIYAQLYTIRHSCEQMLAPNRTSDAPSLQDIVNVALKRLIKDWQDENKQNLLQEELLEQRRTARSNMGRRKSEDT
ncbi:hypothetical protein I8748_32400 [Nostoc sp. CENA67]|uniref:Uncharacterized protein n=1 Tax=Amazonocrinis nigriterrae CENA67 TaxID=2794033 RepID=A0A8J7HXA2_9NOST|nr:hypothetical protein [Amazonocrinis nigriterrae]MBH8566797.1 hypothetical protein [Amazonocrinis nigriterrae CENA67]